MLSVVNKLRIYTLREALHTQCCLYSCHLCSVANKPIMLSVVMLNVIVLNVIMLNAIILNVIMLNVIMLNVTMLNVTMLNVTMLNVTMLNVVMLSIIPLLPSTLCLVLSASMAFYRINQEILIKWEGSVQMTSP
jgi:hypothetical protein